MSEQLDQFDFLPNGYYNVSAIYEEWEKGKMYEWVIAVTFPRWLCSKSDWSIYSTADEKQKYFPQKMYDDIYIMTLRFLWRLPPSHLSHSFHFFAIKNSFSAGIRPNNRPDYWDILRLEFSRRTFSCYFSFSSRYTHINAAFREKKIQSRKPLLWYSAIQMVSWC